MWSSKAAGMTTWGVRVQRRPTLVDLAAELGTTVAALRALAARLEILLGADRDPLDSLVEEVLRQTAPGYRDAPKSPAPASGGRPRERVIEPLVCVFCGGGGEETCRSCDGSGRRHNGAVCDGNQDCVGPCMGSGLLPDDLRGAEWDRWLTNAAAIYNRMRLQVLSGRSGRVDALQEALTRLEQLRNSGRRREHVFFTTIGIGVAQAVIGDGSVMLTDLEYSLVQKVLAHGISGPPRSS